MFSISVCSRSHDLVTSKYPLSMLRWLCKFPFSDDRLAKRDIRCCQNYLIYSYQRLCLMALKSSTSTPRGRRRCLDFRSGNDSVCALFSSWRRYFWCKGYSGWCKGKRMLLYGNDDKDLAATISNDVTGRRQSSWDGKQRCVGVSWSGLWMSWSLVLVLTKAFWFKTNWLPERTCA
jgi:hypothetical protein